MGLTYFLKVGSEAQSGGSRKPHLERIFHDILCRSGLCRFDTEFTHICKCQSTFQSASTGGSYFHFFKVGHSSPGIMSHGSDLDRSAWHRCALIRRGGQRGVDDLLQHRVVSDALCEVRARLRQRRGAVVAASASIFWFITGVHQGQHSLHSASSRSSRESCQNLAIITTFQ